MTVGPDNFERGEAGPGFGPTELGPYQTGSLISQLRNELDAAIARGDQTTEATIRERLERHERIGTYGAEIFMAHAKALETLDTDPSSSLDTTLESLRASGVEDPYAAIEDE